MPRPGPRPYECVRRAWHSDRHQPMRGSIIQQIFRVVQESHTPATKKNKEWREKLPIVVLKAEEIMYSKANSEAEYMDLETLWDRVNEAINTIIRRDESTETGDPLPPCVEAALNLGCVPVRASRSQRNANLGSYLCSRSQEPGCVRPKILDGTTNERNPQLLPLHSGNQLPPVRPLAVNLTHSVTESNRHVTLNNNPTNSCDFPLTRAEVPPSSNSRFVPVENRTSANVGAVYPLYYGTNFQSEMPHLGFQLPRSSNAIIIGTPISPSVPEPAKTGCLQNLFSQSASNRVSQADFRHSHKKSPETGCSQNLFSPERYGSASRKVKQADFKNNDERAPETDFDLSLRLGLFKDPCTSLEKVLVHGTDNVDLSGFQEGSPFDNQSPHQNKEFSFFPVEAASDPLRFCESRWNSKGEDQNAEATVRKRKTPFNNNTEDVFSSQPEFRSNQFTGQMKRPGL